MFSLESIELVLERLHQPQDCFEVIHVAGTNGKGSTTLFASSLLNSLGYRVGTFTSPHLHRVNERIAVDGVPISDEELSRALEAVRLEAGDVKLSYFEAVTAAAFCAFRSLQVEWVVLEAGLGGRLDATNVIQGPKVCGITSIGLDHQNVLGESIEQIAREKAGIITRESKVVLGSLPDDALSVVQRQASDVSAECSQFGEDFSVESTGEGRYRFSSSSWDREVDFEADSESRAHNASVAMELAIAAKGGLKEPETAIKRCFWPGRLEFLELSNCRVLLDCAHNPDGIHSLISFLDSISLRPEMAVVGFLNTKNWKEMLLLLMERVDSFAPLEPKSAVRVSRSEISSFLIEKNVKVVETPQDLLQAIQFITDRFTDSRPTILVCGSIYLVAELRSQVAQTVFDLWK